MLSLALLAVFWVWLLLLLTWGPFRMFEPVLSRSYLAEMVDKNTKEEHLHLVAIV